jgi:quercetin dioxygenase-like cupin family protein
VTSPSWTAIQGQAPRMLKAGDSAYIPRGTVHRNQNLTDKPAHDRAQYQGQRQADDRAVPVTQ